MRKELAKEEGTRKKFRAVFARLGKKTSYKGYREDTILLTAITDVTTNKIVADHLWFSFTKGFENIQFSPGVQLEFEARVKGYAKGYVNSKYQINKTTTDYKLSHPTKIILIKTTEVR